MKPVSDDIFEKPGFISVNILMSLKLIDYPWKHWYSKGGNACILLRQVSVKVFEYGKKRSSRTLADTGEIS